MASKERERQHLTALADAIGDPRLLTAEAIEPPDFLLAGLPRIGIEITEFDDGAAPSDGGGTRVQSSLRGRVIELAERAYYGAAGLPLHVDVEFRDWPALTKSRVRVVAEQIAAFLAADQRQWRQYDNPETLGGYAISSIPEIAGIDAIRVPTRAHGAWSSGAGGWVHHASGAEIERIVRAKELKLPRYRHSCDHVWLVIVFDLYEAGDHVAGPMEPVSFTLRSGFDRLLCFDRIAHRAVDIPTSVPREV